MPTRGTAGTCLTDLGDNDVLPDTAPDFVFYCVAAAVFFVAAGWLAVARGDNVYAGSKATTPNRVLACLRPRYGLQHAAALWVVALSGLLLVLPRIAVYLVFLWRGNGADDATALEVACQSMYEPLYVPLLATAAFCATVWLLAVNVAAPCARASLRTSIAAALARVTATTIKKQTWATTRRTPGKQDQGTKLLYWNTTRGRWRVVIDSITVLQ